MGAVRATPGGSKPTTSKRSRSDAGIIETASGRKSTPEAPGPPGLTSSEPIFRPDAGRRSMAISIVPLVGSSGSRGTGTEAHWNPFGPAAPSHGAHLGATGAASRPAAAGDAEAAGAVGAVERRGTTWVDEHAAASTDKAASAAVVVRGCRLIPGGDYLAGDARTRPGGVRGGREGPDSRDPLRLAAHTVDLRPP